MTEIVKDDLTEIRRILNEKLHINSYNKIERLGGLTNHTYLVETIQGQFVFRIPGEGTEAIISRTNEKISTMLACKLKIDTELILFESNGLKVSKFIPHATTLTSELIKDENNIRKVAKVLNILHTCGENTMVPFEVFDMAKNYENAILENKVELFSEYHAMKYEVMKIKSFIDKAINVIKVPCHNDPLCENWVLGEDKLYLIDWEYAGMNDPMWDLADVSIEANYSDLEDRKLLEDYFGRKATELEMLNFLANKIYLDYLWSLWGKTRVPYDGEEMERYARVRFDRMMKNVQVFTSVQLAKN